MHSTSRVSFHMAVIVILPRDLQSLEGLTVMYNTTQDIRSKITLNLRKARPFSRAYGTGPYSRESEELSVLSPCSHTWPSGTCRPNPKSAPISEPCGLLVPGSARVLNA